MQEGRSRLASIPITWAAVAPRTRTSPLGPDERISLAAPRTLGRVVVDEGGHQRDIAPFRPVGEVIVGGVGAQNSVSPARSGTRWAVSTVALIGMDPRCRRCASRRSPGGRWRPDSWPGPASPGRSPGAHPNLGQRPREEGGEGAPAEVLARSTANGCAELLDGHHAHPALLYLSRTITPQRHLSAPLPRGAHRFVATLGELRYHLSTWHSRNPLRDAPAWPVTTGSIPFASSRVVPETADASSFVLDVPADLRSGVRLRGRAVLQLQGLGGRPAPRAVLLDVLRAGGGHRLRVTVKRTPDGVVSTG